jgi:hypothetical protein
MKGESYLIMIYFFIGLFFSACAKECEEINNTIFEWMPYQTNDEIVFSKNDDKDTLIVTSSQIYHTNKISFGGKCSCVNFFILRLSNDSIKIDITFYDLQNIERSEMWINSEFMEFSEQLDTLQLEGETFTDLTIYNNIVINSYNRIDKIIISKSIGIIGIICKSINWIIIDPIKRQTDPSEIELIDISC